MNGLNGVVENRGSEITAGMRGDTSDWLVRLVSDADKIEMFLANASDEDCRFLSDRLRLKSKTRKSLKAKLYRLRTIIFA